MNTKFTLLYFIFFTTAIFSYTCKAQTVWKVGPQRTYTTPSQVAGLVANGDVVEIDAADYTDCASWNANNLTLKGVGGRPHIKNSVCAGKGIWNLNGLNTTIENIEFSGATNPDQNGAGIRGVGGGFTVRNCYFHNNDDGILAFPAGPLSAGQGEVLVEFCEFYQNGFGDGLSHNLYIGNFQKFTLQFCYVHSAKVGHEVKSRALNNYILYNYITDESSDASRNIDLPNGGNSFLIGNVIEQGSNSANSNIIGYGLEGFSNAALNNLLVVNNTVVNKRTNGSFIMIEAGTGLLKVVNNIFAGNGTLISGTPGTLDSAKNLIRTSVASIGFQNPDDEDYELTSSSPAVDEGSAPGAFDNFDLTPVYEYVHPSARRDRLTHSIIDIGSYEYQNGALSVFNKAGSKSLSSVYPNPFCESFKVSLTTGNLKIQNLAVTDIHGQELINIVHWTEGSDIEIGSELPPGVYILSVNFSSGESAVSRIVKIK